MGERRLYKLLSFLAVVTNSSNVAENVREAAIFKPFSLEGSKSLLE